LCKFLLTITESPDMKEFRAAKKRVEVSDDFQLYSDSARLAVIFNNLISNAIKYRDPGKPKSFVEIRITTTAENCSIVFRDNGIGIPEELQDRIFDMFFRATERSDVEKLNGTITVESAYAEGTTFNIEIPNQYYEGM